MNSIKEPREYIWVLPLIGGVLILISFFTPAFYANLLGNEEYYWMWGLWYGSTPTDSKTIFMATEEPARYMMPIFLSGIIPAVLILIGSIFIIASSMLVKTGRIDIRSVENGWIGMGIMMIVASIIYIIAIDITLLNYLEFQIGALPPGFSIWDLYDPGFAIIAPFIGAGFSIIGSIASKAIKSREVPIFVGERKGPITKTPIGESSHRIKFCSECGHQILYDEGKFCSHCGEPIKY
ncbi:MAG: zinc ribbon domain-containing protein [Promethearchaeota archaeon]